MAREPGVPLSPSDRRLLEYVRAGKVDAEIAARLGISVALVKARIEGLQQRSATTSRSDLVAFDWSAPLAPPQEDRRPAVSSPPVVPGADVTRQTGAGKAPVLLMAAAGLAAVGLWTWTSGGGELVPVDEVSSPPPGVEWHSPFNAACGIGCQWVAFADWEDVPPHADELYRREQARLAALHERCGWDPANDMSFSADHAFACQQSRAATMNNNRPAGVSPVIPPVPPGE